MKSCLYPKSQLERLWREDRKLFMQKSVNPPLFPRYGQPLNSRPAVNTLSRYANIWICQKCAGQCT